MENKKLGIIIAIVEEDFFQAKIDELINLCKTIDIEIIDVVTQNVKERKAGLLGKGKISEIVSQHQDIDVVVAYQPLTPLDIRILSDAFDCVVYDKTRVILQIFAKRAQSKLAKLEVALAEAILQRDELVGSYQEFSRQAGASGSLSARGGGEQQLQIDRRILNRTISKTKREILKEQQKQQIAQKKRKENAIFTVALVGYTNAGKSTLMNRFLLMCQPEKKHKQVTSKDQVFSSLDTTTRRIAIDDHPSFLCVDTVGFIIDLPTHLVASFNTTLASIQEVDCVIVVLDGTYSLSMQLDTIEPYVSMIDHDKRIVVVNKKDQMMENHTPYLTISAKSGEGIHILLDLIKKQKISHYLYKRGYCASHHVYEFFNHQDHVVIKKMQQEDQMVYVEVYCDPKIAHLLDLIHSDPKDIREIS